MLGASTPSAPSPSLILVEGKEECIRRPLVRLLTHSPDRKRKQTTRQIIKERLTCLKSKGFYLHLLWLANCLKRRISLFKGSYSSSYTSMWYLTFIMDSLSPTRRGKLQCDTSSLPFLGRELLVNRLDRIPVLQGLRHLPTSLLEVWKRSHILFLCVGKDPFPLLPLVTTSSIDLYLLGINLSIAKCTCPEIVLFLETRSLPSPEPGRWSSGD